MEVSKLKNMVGDLLLRCMFYRGKYPMEVPDGDISQAFELGDYSRMPAFRFYG